MKLCFEIPKLKLLFETWKKILTKDLHDIYDLNFRIRQTILQNFQNRSLWKLSGKRFHNEYLFKPTKTTRKIRLTKT